MTEPIDILVYSRTHDDVLDHTLSCLETQTKHPHRVILECSDRPAPQNFNAALSRSKSRRVVSLHRDTVVLHPDWLPRLEMAFEDPQLGIVGPVELSTQEALDRFMVFGWPYIIDSIPWTQKECVCLSSTLWMFDRDRIGDLAWNETLGGTCGGAEDDFCARIKDLGLSVRATRDVVVFHEDVPNPHDVWRKHGYETEEEMWQAFRSHRAYLSQTYPHLFENPNLPMPIWPDVKVSA